MIPEVAVTATPLTTYEVSRASPEAVSTSMESQRAYPESKRSLLSESAILLDDILSLEVVLDDLTVVLSGRDTQ